MKPEQERVHSLLKDTVSLLCKNGLNYTQHLKIEGVIGITVDSDVFIVHLDDKFEEEKEKAVQPDSSAGDAQFSNNEMYLKTEAASDNDDDEDLIIMESDIKQEIHAPSYKRTHSRTSEGPPRKIHNLSHRLADVPQNSSSLDTPYITGVMKDVDSVGEAPGMGLPGFDSGGVDTGQMQQQGSHFQLDPSQWSTHGNRHQAYSAEAVKVLLGSSARGTYRSYDPKSMEKACEAVQSGVMTRAEASRMYKVPLTSLRRKVVGNAGENKTSHPYKGGNSSSGKAGGDDASA